MKNATFQCFLEMIFSSFYRLAFVHSILVVAAVSRIFRMHICFLFWPRHENVCLVKKCFTRSGTFCAAKKMAQSLC
jgi:hypothetical protein